MPTKDNPLTRNMHTISGSLGRVIAVALACAGVTAAAGCRGDRSEKPPRQFMPDMDDQQRWNPQTQTKFYADGRSMREPVAGTVAFGRWDGVSEEAWADVYRKDRADLLRENQTVYFGTTADGAFVERIPIPVTRALLERGQERFNIYCVVCHGFMGDGKGMVGQKWVTQIPSFHDPKYLPGGETGQDGYLFHVAMNGVIDVTGAQKMPGYAHALTTDDAWAIVSYIRALQMSQRAQLADVPERERRLIERQLGASDGGGS